MDRRSMIGRVAHTGEEVLVGPNGLLGDCASLSCLCGSRVECKVCEREGGQGWCVGQVVDQFFGLFVLPPKDPTQHGKGQVDAPCWSTPHAPHRALACVSTFSAAAMPEEAVGCTQSAHGVRIRQVEDQPVFCCVAEKKTVTSPVLSASTNPPDWSGSLLFFLGDRNAQDGGTTLTTRRRKRRSLSLSLSMVSVAVCWQEATRDEQATETHQRRRGGFKNVIPSFSFFFVPFCLVST